MKSWHYLGIFALLAAACAGVKTHASDPPRLDQDFASRAVKLSLHCVGTELPHYDEGQGKDKSVRPRHPAFFGCYDWHSAVHGHWAMLRAADVVDGLPEKNDIVDTLVSHLSAENLRTELAFLLRNPKFEEPYGWGWALRLAEEARLSRLPVAPVWREAIAPLEEHLEFAMRGYLDRQRDPNRVGTHNNTAYAMIHAWDYARTAGKADFRKFLERKARHLYAADQDCPLYNEPGPFDFISPCFVEADLMRRVLAPVEFREWYSRFLPNVTPEQLRPVPPTDLHNPYQVHLVGLMYEKSSAMSGVALALDPEDPRRAMLLNAVQDQIDTAGRLMFESDYGGTHWLASFAIYYYSGVGIVK